MNYEGKGGKRKDVESRKWEVARKTVKLTTV